MKLTGARLAGSCARIPATVTLTMTATHAVARTDARTSPDMGRRHIATGCRPRAHNACPILRRRRRTTTVTIAPSRNLSAAAVSP